MAQNNVTTGVKITVDASDIQNKFTKSVDELNASLSKNQRALGLVYNEQGILTNALGQTVEGLSQSSIKLGQYVDELGRVRTYQDGFVEGLTKTQIELGQYSDELGNVYDRYGQLIGQTEKAKKAQEAEAAAAAKAAEANANASRAIQNSLMKATGAAAKVAGQFAIFQQLLQQTGASSTEFGASIAKTANAFAIAAGSFKASTKLVNALSGALKVIPAQLAATETAAASAAPAVATLGAEAQATGVAFSALGGPITLAISAVAALSAGFLAFKSAKTETDKLATSFEELEKKANAAGETIRSVADALKFGAFSAPETELEAVSKKLLDARDALKKATDDYLDAQQRATEATAAAGRYVAGPSRAAFKLDELDANLKNAIAEYNDVAAKYVDAARERQKTEEQKIKEQRDAYAALLKVAEKVGNDENANVFRTEIERLDAEILAAREKQAKEANAAAEAEREKTLAASGVLEYVKRAEDAQRSAAASLDGYEDAVANWTKLVESGALSSNDLAKAQSEFAAELRDAIGKKLGVSFSVAEKGAASELDELARALDAGIVSQEQYNDAVKQLERKAKEDAGKKLGVSFEKPETVDKFAELSKLLDEGTIVQSEYDEALRQLKDAARAALPSFDVVPTLKESQESYKKAVEDAAKAFERGIVDARERDALIARASDELAKAREDAAKAARDEYQRATDEAATLYAEGLISAKERDKRLKEATEELERARRDAAKEAKSEYTQARKEAERLYAEGLIDAKERDKLLARASSELARARQAAAKEADADRQAAEAERKNRRAALGVDALMESLKSPVQKYKETLDKIAEAFEKNAINFDEVDALRSKAAETYLKTIQEDADRVANQAEDVPAESSERQKTNELARSYSAGSEELYLAQVRNATSSYQTAIQETTRRIETTAATSAQNSTLLVQYFQQLLEQTGDGVPVWI